MSCLWRWRRQKNEARAAAAEAERNFSEAREQGREVARTVSNLARIRVANHFAERIYRALRGTE